MSSQSWTPFPLPSPYHLSASSQCTSPKHPVSCIEPRLVISFLYIIHVSMPFSQILPSPSPSDSSILAWRIPWTEKPGGLQFMGSQRVRCDWASNTLQGYKYSPWLLIGSCSYQSIKFITCVISVPSLTEFQNLSTTKFNGKTCSVTCFYLLSKYS